MFPRWLWLALVTNLLWGAWGLQSKLMVDRVSPWTGQVLFVLGLVPLAIACAILQHRHVRRSADTPSGQGRRGARWGFVTGLFAAGGNVAFYAALDAGGSATLVTVVTCLFPIVTVLLARVMLRETMNRTQMAGLALAIVAGVLLSA